MSANASKTPLTSRARATYRVQPLDVAEVLCHRRGNGGEEYLIRWKTLSEPLVSRRAVCSWHSLKDLTLCLHHVQTYIEKRGSPRAPAIDTIVDLTGDSAPSFSRKRKSPDSDPSLSRDAVAGLLTPRDSAHDSREASVVSIGSFSDASDVTKPLEVFNGVLQRRAGRITAKRSREEDVIKVNATKLPTSSMLEAAATAPTATAERLIREAFFQKLKHVPGVRLENDVDTSTPSLDFTFIKEFILRDGVYRADLESSEGCQKPCRPNMGQNIGCEYTKLCICLEFAAVDENKLAKDKPERYQTYMAQKEANGFIDTNDLPKRFPYHHPNVDKRIPSTLQAFYREQRHCIYECNINCACGPICKSRVAQKGRKVPLTIFKTADRGWGMYCDEDLVRGEFIDTYLGEVITNEEATRREEQAGKEKASYLYSLDKFVGDDETLTDETCYVVDGQYMGGPTRFINHSCEPNCRQYTVSYNKHDIRVYDLAFFAYEDIPKGTELTFDYVDPDEEEEEDVIRKREAAANDPKNTDKVACNCGARKCRGYVWE